MNEMVIQENERLGDFMLKHESKFATLNKRCINKLDFAKECEFAKQQLLKNDYTLGVARNNAQSLSAAIKNVAAIGISLNPAMQWAYLVPRDKAICLDISYRGLIKLATDTGLIRAMKAELVYENDLFAYKGFHMEPEFKSDPFGDRGALKGVYAMALMADGGVLVETMKIDEVYKIRDDSKAYQKAKRDKKLANNVWVKFETEMVKKTVIKRAYKTLPPSKGTEILGQAIDVINEHEGIEFNEGQTVELHYSDQQSNEYKRCIEENDYFNIIPIMRQLSAEGQKQLYDLHVPKPQRGQIGAKAKEFNQAMDEAEAQLQLTIESIPDLLDTFNESGIQELLEDCSEITTEYILSKLSNEHQMQLREIKAAA